MYDSKFVGDLLRRFIRFLRPSGTMADRVAVYDRKPRWALVIAGIAILRMAIRTLDYQYGRRPIQVNSKNAWWPIAQEVFAGGRLYLSHWDNKPPLWQFFNLLVARLTWWDITVYAVVFWGLIAIAMTLTALLIWEFLDREGYAAAGLIAGLLTVLITSRAIEYIDPRPFANVLIIYAFYTRSDAKSGLSISAAGLLTQFSVLAIPPLLAYRIWHYDGEWRRTAVTFCSAGIALVAVSFLAVGAIWGLDAMVTGWRYSMFPLSDYVGRYTERGYSIFSDPIAVGRRELMSLISNWLWTIGFGAIALAAWYQTDRFDWPFIPTACVVTALLWLPNFIRPSIVYDLPVTLLGIPLAALGMQTIFEVYASADGDGIAQ